MFEPVRFGERGEPFEIAVTNGGELPLDTSALQIIGPASSDFALIEDGCSGTSLPAGGGCFVSVRFTPSEVGVREATLELIGRRTVPLALSAESTAPRLDAQPAEVRFEAHGVGERATGSDLVVRNGGTADLALQKVYVEGRHAEEFQVAGRCDEKRLAPGESCSFRIAFRPGAAGSRSAELVLETDTPTGVERIVLTGTGVWDGPELVAEPAAVDAGLRRVGSRSGGSSVRFVNRAAQSVEVASLKVSVAAFRLAEDGCSGARLEAGDGCSAAVVFAPSAEGAVAGTLDLRLAGGGGASVALAGRGGVSRLEAASPTIDFGDARVEGEEVRDSIELASTGEIALAIGEIGLDGRSASSFRVIGGDCGAETVEPGAWCRIEVGFRPVTDGELEARIVVASDAAAGELEIPLRGVGAAGILSTDPERVNFGSVHRGEGTDESVRLRNGGSAPLRVRRVSIGGGAEAEYLLTDDGCSGETLAIGEDCGVGLRFLPGREGRRLAFLVLDHDAIRGPGEVALSGEGLPPVPTIRVEPARIDFERIRVGEIGPIQTVTIRNPGLGPLEVRDIALVGAGRDQYRRVDGTCAGVPRLAPRSECSFGLRFVPTSEGEHRATLAIDHNAPGGQSRVELSGQGFAPSPPPVIPVPVPTDEPR